MKLAFTPNTNLPTISERPLHTINPKRQKKQFNKSNKYDTFLLIINHILGSYIEKISIQTISNDFCINDFNGL